MFPVYNLVHNQIVLVLNAVKGAILRLDHSKCAQQQQQHIRIYICLQRLRTVKKRDAFHNTYNNIFQIQLLIP